MNCKVCGKEMVDALIINSLGVTKIVKGKHAVLPQTYPTLVCPDEHERPATKRSDGRKTWDGNAPDER